jgi:hypothetical protein
MLDARAGETPPEMPRRAYLGNKDDIRDSPILMASGLDEMGCFVRFWDTMGCILRVAFAAQGEHN